MTDDKLRHPVTGIRFSAPVLRRIENLSRRDYRSRVDVIRLAVLLGLPHLESGELPKGEPLE